MNEGLVGLVIMIAIFNIGARIMRSLSGPKKQPKLPPPGAASGTPIGLTEDDPRTKFYDEAEIARIREAASPFPEKIIMPAPDEIFEEVLEPDKDERPGDFAKWDEASFEKEPHAPAYKPEYVPESQPSDALPSYTEPVRRTVPDVIEGSEGIHKGAYALKARKTETVTLEDITSELGDLAKIRRAFVLSTVLGPCKAKSRRH